ncbi:MAG: efflux RND transporter permease subunit, partial [Micrococcales bacterium]|nr:efflux RND transporter permease subunit [Micrococcales bacterium]
MHQLTRVSLANRPVVALLTLLLMGVGVFAAGSLKQELFPSLELPSAAVVASYPGASPDIVEREVTGPIEDAVKGVSGVQTVRSTTTRGVSQVVAEWDYGSDSATVRSDIEGAVNGVRARLPQNVDPSIMGGDLGAIPIIALSVTATDNEATLARKLKDVAVPKLSGIKGVRSVTVSGAREDQVVVTFRPSDVTRYGVVPGTLPQVLQAAGVAIPAGNVSVKGNELDIQVGRPLGSVKDLQRVRLQGTDGPVTLSQVASVTTSPVDATSLSRTNGKPSLGLSVVKETDGNTVTVARDVRDALPSIAQQMGGGASFSTVFDQAPFIEKSIENLGTEGLLGLVFAVLVIFVFLLSVRSTIIAAISIPTSLLIALIGLWQTDQSLNIFTLGALTVAIGRVVDDSIVVIENIKRHVGLGQRGAGAIIGAVREVATAVTASTITTVAVFLPLALVSGEVGELFRPFALAVSIALVASLLVSLTIVPVLASWFIAQRSAGHRAKRPGRGDRLRRAGWLGRSRRAGLDGAARDGVGAKTDASAVPKHDHEAVTWLQRPYLPTLRWTLAHRGLTLLIAVLIFAGSVALAPKLRTDFLGDSGQDTLSVSQELPAGSTLQVTDAAAKKVEAVLRADPAITSVQTTVGGGQERAAFGGAAGSATASMVVALRSGESATDVSQRLRDRIGALRGLGEVTVSAGGGPANSDVAIKVQGNDLATLRTGSEQIAAMMRKVAGLNEVRSDLAASNRQLQVDINASKAAAVGMTQADIGAAVTAAVRGTPGGDIVIGDTTEGILVRTQQPATNLARVNAIELPVSAKQTMDARKAAAEKVSDQQQAMQDRQQADGRRQAAKQVEQLREGRTKAREQTATLQRQLRALRAPRPAPAVPDPRGLAAQAAAQQVAQLQAALTQASKQVETLDEQISSAQEQQDKAAEQADKAKRLADAAKAAQEVQAKPKKLSEVATAKVVSAPSTITRTDGVRTVTVTAKPTGGDLSATNTALEEGLAKVTLPAGVAASIGGVSADQQEAFRQLGLAMLIAIAIVFLVMVGTFRSLAQPLILLVSIPFAATGAIGLLLLTDTALGLPAMIGLLMLIGIVVTNAIVLIDLVNQYRAAGVGIEDAIIDGARLRLRPIIMTAMATICALIPMALGLTGGGVFISRPLAIVVIGGLVTSTLLTLVLVPVLYDLLEHGRIRLARRIHGDDPLEEGQS